MFANSQTKFDKFTFKCFVLKSHKEPINKAIQAQIQFHNRKRICELTLVDTDSGGRRCQ